MLQESSIPFYESFHPQSVRELLPLSYTVLLGSIANKKINETIPKFNFVGQK